MFLRLAPMIALLLSSPVMAGQVADYLFAGGTIYTADDASPKARAVAVADGRIIFVGDEKGAMRLVGPKTKSISLKGAVLYPGLTDSHVHLAGVGNREITLNLEGSPSIVAVQKALADYAKANPTDPIIIGRGWIETHWPEKRFLSARDIDAVVDARPVILTRADGHALVANKAAMKAMGIDRTTPDPDGGRIAKDSNGEPDGMFVDHAQSLMAGLMKAPSAEQYLRQVKIGAEVYAKLGWTGAHTMSTSYGELMAAEALAAKSELPLRVYAAVTKEAMDKLLTGLGAIPTAARPGTNDLVSARTVKIYMDGALGSRGAALLAPYSDSDTRGLILMKHEEAAPFLAAMLRAGVQVAAHAIGDAGNRMALDWFEEAFAAVPPDQRAVAEPRWRIEHAQIISPADIERFAKLGVIASMQPSHAIGDLFFAPSRLGPDRLNGAYAWNSLIQSGALVVGGSDAPVERGEPMIEFYAAIARRDLKGFQDAKTWHPEQAVSRDQALKMFTLWPAKAAFMEKDLGSINVGKRADFTILDQDIMKIDAPQILKTKALMTMIDGKIAYQAPGFGK